VGRPIQRQVQPFEAVRQRQRAAPADMRVAGLQPALGGLAAEAVQSAQAGPAGVETLRAAGLHQRLGGLDAVQPQRGR
jgi:hypothetical protein